MGCSDMSRIAEAKHHDRFIVNFKASNAEAKEIIANRLGWRAEFAVEDGPDGGRRIVGRVIGWVLVVKRFEGSGPGSAVETEHKQAERNGFAQASVKMEAAVDFHGREEDGDGGRGRDE